MSGGGGGVQVHNLFMETPLYDTSGELGYDRLNGTRKIGLS